MQQAVWTGLDSRLRRPACTLLVQSRSKRLRKRRRAEAKTEAAPEATRRDRERGQNRGCESDRSPRAWTGQGCGGLLAPASGSSKRKRSGRPYLHVLLSVFPCRAIADVCRAWVQLRTVSHAQGALLRPGTLRALLPSGSALPLRRGRAPRLCLGPISSPAAQPGPTSSADCSSYPSPSPSSSFSSSYWARPHRHFPSYSSSRASDASFRHHARSFHRRGVVLRQRQTLLSKPTHRSPHLHTRQRGIVATTMCVPSC